ncbi:MAG: class II histone deacetylase [Rhodobacter sp.]|nr:class II histone deacetylase [Rhodobacter sp.]
MTRTGFFWDERTFWHSGGNYALTFSLGDLVQPLAAGGLPESPETKRRLKNLIDVTGLIHELDAQSAPEATREALERVHPPSYLDVFKRLSDAGGGELGMRTPFGQGGFEIAALSAGLATTALAAVLDGRNKNAYSLSRPPGHHCLPDFPNGFCLFNNIAIAIRAAQAAGQAQRIAVVDWDVHHGNGTEAIFLEDADVLTISIHQEHNYPLDTGDPDVLGEGSARGTNMNIPLPPGAGHATYLEAMQWLVLPKLRAFQPEAIVVACGYDAAAYDPLAQMTASALTFRMLTRLIMQAADELCDGRLVLVHEGGYSEAYVPFCAHAVLQELSGSSIEAPDPKAETLRIRQPNARMQAAYSEILTDLVQHFGLAP